MLEFIIDHLWQSTLIVVLAWGATRSLKRYGAHWRYRIWFAASMKFLVPFAVFVQLGAQIPWPATPAGSEQDAWRAMAARMLQPSSSLRRPAPAEPAATAADDSPLPPGSLAAQVLAPALSSSTTGPSGEAAAATRAAVAASPAGGNPISLTLVAAGIWFLGSALLLARWCRSWVMLRGLLRRARPINEGPAEPGLPELRACSSVMEPGIFGIFRPVLLIPERLIERLSRDQLRAIIRHEQVHAERRDNLTASLHMLVEALFWFHPFVWLIGARMVEERERACDEAVLASGVDPEIYATSLIEVCDFYVESPLLCAAGVGGGPLESRVRRIANNEQLPLLGRLGQAVLIAAPVAICLVPLALGLLQVRTVSAQQVDAARYGTLLECVNPDVLASLVFRGAAASNVVTDEVPPEMAGITPPAEFEWLGSYRRDLAGVGGVIGMRGSVTAGFKTSLAPDAASETAAAGLIDAGWEAAPQLRSGFGGAFAAAGPSQPRNFCRDESSVSIDANAIDGITYVNYGFSIGQISSVCQESGGLMGNMPGSEYAPSLELPTDPETGQPARRGGSGSSGTQSRVEIRYNGSLADLTDHMTAQLVEQGWINDASWMGTTTAGSSWWKQANPQTRVQGTLDVTATADTSYTIMFRLVELR